MFFYLQVLTGGVSNHLAGFHVDGGDRDDMVLVRVYGLEKGMFTDRDVEVKKQKFLIILKTCLSLSIYRIPESSSYMKTVSALRCIAPLITALHTGMLLAAFATLNRSELRMSVGRCFCLLIVCNYMVKWRSYSVDCPYIF